jgi:hypothetical protein
MTHFFSNEMSLVLAVLEVSLHTSFLLPVPISFLGNDENNQGKEKIIQTFK